MIKVFNDNLPIDGYIAMTIWPFIFVRNEYKNGCNGVKFTEVDENHETIHGMQQLEMLPISAAITLVMWLVGCGWWSLLGLPFYFWWYILEWFLRMVIYLSQKEAYRNISFEQEAYLNEEDLTYLNKRKHFAWLRFLFKKTYRKP